MNIKEPLCFSCAHLTVYPECKAFPDGIPEDIRNGTHPHIDPYEGDNGITFSVYQTESEKESTRQKNIINKLREQGRFKNESKI